MIVMKFGGTSVEDAQAMKRMMEIVRGEKGRRPLVVLSACAGVTNDLIRAAETVKNGDKEKALNILDKLRTRHRIIVEELFPVEKPASLVELLDEMFQELRNLVRGVHLLGELTPRSLDTFMSYGERLSSAIAHRALCSAGVPSLLTDAREVMITDRTFGAAQPQADVVAERSRCVFGQQLETDHIVVTQGFIGATADGSTTTIGRGGSDYSAAVFGAALEAEEIQIWTDVDGMMTADPRIVPTAKRITALSFDEASELAYFGAKVLHPRTIQPAVQKNIPVRILNSRRPEIDGTMILSQEALSRSPKREGAEVIKAIAWKKGITVINVNSSRMLMAHGFLAKLFSIFADHRKSVDVVATSEVSVSLTIDNTDDLSLIRTELEEIGETRIIENKAIICIVGEGMKHTPGIGARIFSALGNARVNIEMVSEGASEINLTLVVDESAVHDAVHSLHKEFFGSA